jgi:hypothetical protein
VTRREGRGPAVWVPAEKKSASGAKKADSR